MCLCVGLIVCSMDRNSLYRKLLMMFFLTVLLLLVTSSFTRDPDENVNPFTVAVPFNVFVPLTKILDLLRTNSKYRCCY